MEHRWGERVGVDLPVRITAHAFNVQHGRLVDLSVSGACITTDFDLRMLSRIQIVIHIPHKSRFEAPTLAAYVARVSKGSVGVEWCEFAPPAVGDLLASIASRPYMRLRRRERLPAHPAVAALSEPLLKHGM